MGVVVPVPVAPVIDVHAHALVPQVEIVVADEPGLRREPRPEPAVRDRLLHLERRLADMDAAGVDGQVVSPAPSQYHPWAPPDLAGTVYRLAHEGIA